MNNSPIKSTSVDEQSIEHLSIDGAKALAKRLRVQLEKDGQQVSHSKSLELIAAQHGFRDWNTMFASLGNRAPITKPPVSVGQRVRGHYLGHAFVASVLGVQTQSNGNRYRVTIKLDDAVDVVSFDSFSSLRKRISSTINQDGATTETNSDGVPILKLDI